MGRRRRFGEDLILHEYVENFRRADATLGLAIGMLLGWLAFTGFALVGPPALWNPAIPRIFATFLGWGGLLVGVWSGLQYAYAYLYPYLISRIGR